MADDIEFRVHQALESRKKFRGGHWFCPAYDDEDGAIFNDPNEDSEDWPAAKKQERVTEAIARLKVVHELFLVMGLHDMVEEQKTFMLQLEFQLCRCFECNRKYHKTRDSFLRQMGDEHGEEVSQFYKDNLDVLDFERIDKFLIKAKEKLQKTPDVDRKVTALMDDDPRALLSMSDALCNESYYTNDERLAVHFDEPFRMIQTNRVMKVTDMLPGTTRFLFSADPIRQRFARTSWELTKDISQSTFNWAVRKPLRAKFRSIKEGPPNTQDTERFWAGMIEIFNKLNRDHTSEIVNLNNEIVLPHYLIHCFLNCKSDELFSLLIKAFRLLIEKCPDDFYEKFSGASAWSVAENILKSPSFTSSLSEYNPDETAGATSWCQPFIKSLRVEEQSKACDSLLHHLFEQLQSNEALDQDAKALCLKTGLVALGQTVKSFSADDVQLSKLHIRTHIRELLGLVNKYKQVIFMCTALQDPTQEDLPRLAMMVIRDTIRLDCKVIRAEYSMIEEAERETESGRKPQSLTIHITGESIQIWNLVKDAFTTDSLDLAKNLLMGMGPLIGVEPFVKKSKEASLLPDMVTFNNSFAELCSIVACLIERLNDLKQEDLGRLIHNQATAFPMYGSLVSPNQEISQAMSMVLKTYTEELTRTEALAKLMNEKFVECITGVCWGIKTVSGSESFAAMPLLLTVGREVLQGLCNTTGGVLRERDISQAEQGPVKLFWRIQWNMLKTCFAMLETWSKQADSGRAKMSDFARDAMDFANELFDEYSTLRSAFKSPKNHKDDLLSLVVNTMDTMVKWLRLKDTYLAGKLHELICKILRRLGEEDIVLDPSSDAVRYMKEVASIQPVIIKTNLTDPQKAELRRAIDSNQGFEIIDEPHRAAVKKQSKLDGWSLTADAVKREPQSARDMISSLTPNAHKAHLERMKRSSAEARRKAEESRAAENKLFLEKRRKAKEESDRAKQMAIQRHKGVSVPGEGSGLRGLGVQGKDHTPKIEGIMVDSDSESEEDEEGDAEVAALFRNKPTSSFSATEAARRKQQIQGPVVKTKMVRSAKDMRARLSPNMDPLHQTILNWNFFHQGETPPDSLECQMIANKFMAAHEYKATMYPLLVSEAWKDLLTVREESRNGKSKPFDLKIVNRMSVDNYIEVTTSVSFKEMRDGDISEGCIVLLSQGHDPLRDEKAPNCLARVFKVGRNPQNREKMDISYRVSNRVKSELPKSLTPGSEIRGVMLTQLTTLEREFAALHSLEYYDLCDEILNAKPSPILKYHNDAIVPIEQNYKVNKAQAKAILSAKENDAFTLVQGPPGSGKTKTIVAMVGAILTNVLASQGTAIARPTPASGAAGQQAIPKKLLICAPSNAAVDEIVSRLKAGVKTMRGNFHKINVLRIGRLSTINSNVHDVSLEKLTNNQLEGSGEESRTVLEEQAKRNKLHEDAGELKQLIASLRGQVDEARSSGNKAREDELRRELDTKRRAQATIGSMIEQSKNAGNVVGRNKDIKRRELQQKLINQAHVVCATLAGSGHDMFKNMAVEFETVIIDEAAQCIELSALIPLKYGCSKCILVGDPKQLPPTVLSKMAASYGYEQSLFVRMQKNHPSDIHLLDTQYRMHPDISEFPSQQFYEGQLLDGHDMKALRRQPWHSNSLLGPYRFFDVKGAMTRGQGHSYLNMAEIQVALQLYQRVTSDYRGVDWKGKVGIITPYKAQLFQLRLEFQQRYGDAIFDAIEFNTTDAFQGREAEVIIFSCVRAQASGGVGFLNDIRRMNVGLTRAKASLWVLGDSHSLMQGPYWRKLINDAQERGVYTDGDFMSILSKPMADAKSAMAPFNRGIPDASAEPVTATDSRLPSAAQVTSATQSEIENSMRRSSIQDVEMYDAPLPSFSATGAASSSSSAAPQAAAVPGDLLFAQRGRMFGLMCQICGSYAHVSIHCDNEDALSRKSSCHRCGEKDHYSDTCRKDRCMKCGAFGHTDKYCVAQPLPVTAMKKLESDEARFERIRIARAEKRKIRNENGHNPQIPTIATTAPGTEPGLNTRRPSNAATIPGLNAQRPIPSAQRPSLNDNNKRQRASSPSDDMANKKIPTQPRGMDGRQIPTGPRAMDGRQVPSRPRFMDGSDDRSPTLSNRSGSAEDTKPAASNGNRPGPSMQQNRPPQGLIPVRRKKPQSDPFIQRKPRR